MRPSLDAPYRAVLAVKPSTLRAQFAASSRYITKTLAHQGDFIIKYDQVQIFLIGGKMPRISEHFELNRDQPTLDFVDVDINYDLRVFVDPRSLNLIDTQWGHDCIALVQSFFEKVLILIKKKNSEAAIEILQNLREPNETHLGFSSSFSRGRGVGTDLAKKLWSSISESQAAKSGLLKDLDDTVLFIEGISSDIISDITTNVIREPLINYTQAMCNWYEIPMVPNVATGPMWDPAKDNWFESFTDLPVGPRGKLLFVPKAIVRRRMEYDSDEYYNDYILEFYRGRELQQNSNLVRMLKNGKRIVTKKDLKAKYGMGKKTIVEVTLQTPSLLAEYRTSKKNNVRPPLSHQEFATEENSNPPNWNQLLKTIECVELGKAFANEYEKAIEAFVTALFYPHLTNPKPQQSLHDGRKRVDIEYTNISRRGFFYWLARHYRAPKVFVECKNYSSDPKNPELDQLSGRFSRTRGQFGLLISRKIKNKELFEQRCIDTAKDGRGFIVALDDDDLRKLVHDLQDGNEEFELLRQKFDRLIG